MARIELNWGGGSMGIALDIRKGQVLSYGARDTSRELRHDEYGGKCYYTSRSGMSGAGWIPARPWIHAVQGYRTDTRCFEWPGISSSIFGHCISVPYDYRASRLDEGFPAVVQRVADGKSFLTHLDDVASVVAGEEEGFEEKSVDFSFISAPGEEVQTQTFEIWTNWRTPRQFLRRVIEAASFDELCFHWPEKGNVDRPSPFWSRLGLYPIGDHAYKVTGGICRGSFALAEWSVETLQQFSPGNVAVLNRNVYIQGEGDRWEAVGIFEIEGFSLDYEIHLEPNEAVLLLRGRGLEELTGKLLAGASEKLDQVRRLQARQEAARVTEEQLRALAEEHGDMEVTIEDSLAVGNCRPGTENFRDEFFPGRSSVPVRELVKFMRVPGVRPVLQRKLLPFVPEGELRDPADVPKRTFVR